MGGRRGRGGNGCALGAGRRGADGCGGGCGGGG